MDEPHHRVVEQWMGQQDDEAFAAVVGFTDIVKRPTERASQVRLEEYHTATCS